MTQDTVPQPTEEEARILIEQARSEAEARVQA